MSEYIRGEIRMLDGTRFVVSWSNHLWESGKGADPTVGTQIFVEKDGVYLKNDPVKKKLYTFGPNGRVYRTKDETATHYGTLIASFRDGDIFGPDGELIGRYTEYERKPKPDIIREANEFKGKSTDDSGMFLLIFGLIVVGALVGGFWRMNRWVNDTYTETSGGFADTLAAPFVWFGYTLAAGILSALVVGVVAGIASTVNERNHERRDIEAGGKPPRRSVAPVGLIGAALSTIGAVLVFILVFA